MRFLLPLTEGIRNSKGKGVQEEEISKGVGLDSQGLFSRTLKQEYIIDDLTLTLLAAECFLTAYKILVYM